MMNASTVTLRNDRREEQRCGASRTAAGVGDLRPHEIVGRLEADAQERQRRLGRDETPR